MRWGTTFFIQGEATWVIQILSIARKATRDWSNSLINIKDTIANSSRLGEATCAYLVVRGLVCRLLHKSRRFEIGANRYLCFDLLD